MVRARFRAKSLFLTSLLSVPAFAVAGACSNQQTTAPPGGGGFGFDSGILPHHDATVVKGDADHDAHTDAVGAKDGEHDGARDGEHDGEHDGAREGGHRDGGIPDAVLLGDAGVETPCLESSQCASHVCIPTSIIGKVDGEARFDAGFCGSATAACSCAAPTCTDGVKNGQETDVDCGGSICPPCAVGDTCDVGTDCTQGECGVGFKGTRCGATNADGGLIDASFDAGGVCVCEAPTCSDGVKNGDETDVDCGGTECGACPTGKKCKANSDCTSDVCNTSTGLCSCPPGFTEAPTAGSVPYCISTYEITYKQYSAFVGASTATTVAQQPAECSWNSSFVPSNNWPQVGEEANNPVSYVNWCDALAYCSFLGPGYHLCGSIAVSATHAAGGGLVPLGTQDGGAVPQNDRSIDEWYNACSSEGQNVYPYSSTYSRTACNSADSPAQSNSGPVEIPIGNDGYVVDTGGPICIFDTDCNGADQAGVLQTVAQGATITCHVLAPTMGAQPACGNAFTESLCVGGSSTNIVYDMSGNVAEWEYSCSGTTSGAGGANDMCAVRGGAYDTKPTATTLTCATGPAQPPVARSTQAADIGFRCCY